MDRTHQRRRGIQLFYGLLITIVGVVFLLDNMDIVEAHQVFRFWPVLIILFGFFRLSRGCRPGSRVFGLFWITVGVLLLLDQLDIANVSIWDWWPLILVFIGINILIKRSGKNEPPVQPEATAQGAEDPDAMVDMNGILSGSKRICLSQGFRGGSLTSVMGGCELDLRRASMKSSSAVITIFAVWGGISVRVPQDWTVSLQGTPILGGISDKTHPVPGAAEKLLIIKGEVIMAGAEITN
ncbi:MAG TPA: DUF5668 domain-containing protein [Bacteroidota bacterium]|nr:DUF5668 domain-containing protein [Bacteroidota bacterium]